MPPAVGLGASSASAPLAASITAVVTEAAPLTVPTAISVATPAVVVATDTAALPTATVTVVTAHPKEKGSDTSVSKSRGRILATPHEWSALRGSYWFRVVVMAGCVGDL